MLTIYVKAAKGLCGKVKPVPSGDLKLPPSDFASINRINALRILNLLLSETDFAYFHLTNYCLCLHP